LRTKVEVQFEQLRNHLKHLKRRNKESVWLKRQTSGGELDDSRLVDALSGEAGVFKRRGYSKEQINTNK